MLVFLPHMKLYSKMSQRFFPIIDQNKTKMSEKIGSAWFIYEKFQVISAICKLFQYNFWQNCLEFSNKMYLTKNI